VEIIERLRRLTSTRMKLPLFLFAILLMADLSGSIPKFLARKRRAVSVTFMDMYLRSEGCNDPGVTLCGTTIIQVHGVDHSLHRRGHNIVVVNAKTGVFIESKSFDTHGDGTAGDRMRDYLNSTTGDKVVLIATQDSASNTWQPAADALRRLGVTDPILLEFRGSFAFIGYAGANKPSWIAQEQQKRYEGPSIIHLRIPLQQSAPVPRMSIFLRSEGCDDPGRTLPCGRAFMKVNNQGYSLHARGVNVAVFSVEGVFLETRAFDTHGWAKAGTSVANYLNRLSGE